MAPAVADAHADRRRQRDAAIGLARASRISMFGWLFGSDFGNPEGSGFFTYEPRGGGRVGLGCWVRDGATPF